MRRHVEGFPVVAQRETLRYRAGKFVRRHKGGMLAAVIVTFALLGGIATTTWQAQVAQAERDRAQRRVEQVRTIALSLLFSIDEEVKRLPGNLKVRGLLINAAENALKSLASDVRTPGPQLLEAISRLYTRSSSRSGKLPANWFRSGWSPDLYEMGVDRTVRHGGKASGYIAAKNSARPGAWATLTQQIVTDDYRGRRIRLSAFIRSKDVREGAHLWMRVNTLRGVRALDDMRNRPIKYTTDWLKYEIVLDVPGDSTDISYGILLVGVGTAWVDDLQLEIVDRQVPVTDIIPNRQDEAVRSPSHPTNLGFEKVSK